jgi:RimJ/RimL family protein N-acetyltransferase
MTAVMEIRTKRLRLRELAGEDWTAILAYQQDARYLRYYPWTERTETQVRDFVQMLVDFQREQPRRKFQLAITLRETGELIGNCGIRRKPENEWEADIGYELNPDYWRRGYGSEAAGAMVNFGFRELGLHRVWPGATPRTRARTVSWRSSACSGKDASVRRSSSRADGGTPSSMPCSKTSASATMTLRFKPSDARSVPSAAVI